jgi:hypothetical protein
VATMISVNLRSCGINSMSTLGSKENNSHKGPQIFKKILRPLVRCRQMLSALEGGLGPQLRFFSEWIKVQHNDHKLCQDLQLGDARCTRVSTNDNSGIHHVWNK